jgi:hypothetical protein
MSQYNSSLFSDAVYLFGTTFSSRRFFYNNEELPNGTKVDQKELAKQAVLAAFACLYHKKLIDIVLVERKSLFGKKMTAIVKKLQSSPLDTSGLEAAIFAHVQNNVRIYDITRDVLRVSVNPWGDILQIVKQNLLDRGILKRDEKRELLSQLTTYKYVVNEDISNEDISKEEKKVTELKKTLKELQSKGVLDGILSAIRYGVSSQYYSGGGDGGSGHGGGGGHGGGAGGHF